MNGSGQFTGVLVAVGVAVAAGAVAVATDRAFTLDTASSDRIANRHAFRAAALDLLLDAVGGNAATTS